MKAGRQVTDARTDAVSVLIAESDDSFRTRLKRIMEESGLLRVVGSAKSGKEALGLALTQGPQVVLMNVDMFPMGGLETTRRIMVEAPTPIVVYPSGYPPRNEASVARAFATLQEGAVAVVERPFRAEGGEGWERKLIHTLLNMAQVPVVTRRQSRRRGRGREAGEGRVLAEVRAAPVDIIAVGASTGGPVALKRAFASLPSDFPLPILVVQHIAPGFLQSMMGWLSSECSLEVGIAQNGEVIRGGKIYFAPDACHMGVAKDGRIDLDTSGAIGGMRPAVSFLFGSVASAYGSRSVGVLLSGMGTDGSLALEEMRRGGAVTIVQDQASSAVFGMARRAIEIGGAEHILSPEEIGELLLRLGKLRGGAPGGDTGASGPRTRPVTGGPS